MLSPLAIATWISFCTPLAEPRLVAALVHAGSDGSPFLITEASGQTFSGKSIGEAQQYLSQNTKAADRYIGLTQIPEATLTANGINASEALDTCRNLEIAYALYVDAYNYAAKIEKSPWKTTALAFNYFRSRQKIIETPYSKKAVDFLMKNQYATPAAMSNPLRHAIVAEWSSNLGNRHHQLGQHPSPSVLDSSNQLASTTRQQY